MLTVFDFSGGKTNIIKTKVDESTLDLKTKNDRFVVNKPELLTLDKKFRQPQTRNEFSSFFLHFLAPRPFYKSYSYV